MQAQPVQTAVPSPPRRRRRRRVSGRGWLTLGVAAAALIGGGLAGAAHQAGGWRDLAARAVGRAIGVALRQHPQLRGGAAVTPVAAREPFSILVLGTESAPAYAGPQLTDSMMVMSYDPQARTASIVSVPRDLWVDIPGFGQSRINEAFEDGGIATAELTVEKTLGIPIEYYAIVNYGAFVNLVDTLGGVNVVVPQPGIDDPTYPNPQENADEPFVLPAGPQHLDGATALKFIRERHSFTTGDLQREADQQQVLLALKDELLQVQNLPKLPSIVRSLAQAVTTNVPYADLVPLANTVLQLPKSSITSAVFGPQQVTNWTTAGGAEVLLPDDGGIQQVVRQAFPGLRAAMGAMTVQVENGAPTQQPLATYFTQVLQGMGVQTLPARTAAQTDHRDNEVFVNTAVVTPARGARAPTEAYMLGQMLGAPVQQAPFRDSQAQIVVILGSAFPRVQSG